MNCPYVAQADYACFPSDFFNINLIEIEKLFCF